MRGGKLYISFIKHRQRTWRGNFDVRRCKIGKDVEQNNDASQRHRSLQLISVNEEQPSYEEQPLQSHVLCS